MDQPARGQKHWRKDGQSGRFAQHRRNTPGHYQKASITWTVDGREYSSNDLPHEIKALGGYRHSQYNVSYEGNFRNELNESHHVDETEGDCFGPKRNMSGKYAFQASKDMDNQNGFCAAVLRNGTGQLTTGQYVRRDRICGPRLDNNNYALYIADGVWGAFGRKVVVGDVAITQPDKANPQNDNADGLGKDDILFVGGEIRRTVRVNDTGGKVGKKQLDHFTDQQMGIITDLAPGLVNTFLLSKEEK